MYNTKCESYCKLWALDDDDVSVGCNICTTLVWDIDIGDGVCVWGQGGTRELSTLPAQFNYGPKIALKNKIYLKKQIDIL